MAKRRSKMPDKRGRSPDSRRYYDWLDRAEEDLTSSRALIDNPDCYNSAAFHCQQTIEKALKAFILLKSGMLVDGHNLTWLLRRAAKHDTNLLNWLEGCVALNRCYIETRYPADIPLDIDHRQVISYYGTARDIFGFVCHETDLFINDNMTSGQATGVNQEVSSI